VSVGQDNSQAHDGGGDDAGHDWFIARGPQMTGQAGPFTLDELRQAAADGALSAGDRIRRGDWLAWRGAEGLGEIAASLPARASDVRRSHADRLPLRLLAGIVTCFVLHFGLAARNGAGPSASLSAAAAPAPQGADAPFDLEICNLTAAERVYVAVAYFDRARRDWVARGWFPQKQGECQVAIQRLTPPVYVYGETKDGSARWGDDEAEGLEFCIEGHGAFVLGQRGCDTGAGNAGALGAAAGRRLQRFKRVRFTGEGSLHRWELTE
jgi:uncharacterized membrane protein